MDTATTSGGGDAADAPAGTCPPLRRLGSGGGSSVVLDPPEAGAEAEAESRKLPSSQYKGVVPQPNGRWGTQIYEKHQRVWLGTFNDEARAAAAYDVAAQRFRGRDAVTNFAPLSDADPDGAGELLFLAAHSKAEIVDMLRKHTYHDELQQSRRYLQATGGLGRRSGAGARALAGRLTAKEALFDKVVTPSDVGKLNRLVIPKQHAEKYFPLPTREAAASKGVLLNFEDAGGKVWRFRYSYWNSSQSYVLTKGWSRFVKEKNLKAGDVVVFLRSAGPDRQLHIDWKPCSAAAPGGIPACCPPLVQLQPPGATMVMRLFGVNISEAPSNHGRKRSAEMELFPMASSCSGQKRCTGMMR